MTDQPLPPVQKAVDPDQVVADSVQGRAHQVNTMLGIGVPGLSRYLFYRPKSDLDIPPYGYGGRGLALRRVWRMVGADIIASALAVMIQKVQATAYTITGPQRTVTLAQQMIDNAELGSGWLQFVAKWVAEFCTQDNGPITEILGPGRPLRRFGQIVRHPDGTPVIDPSQPLAGRPLSMAQLDSLACERTGVIETPIRYYDMNGNMHLMNWSRVHVTADMPQPDERLFGYGFCALSRCISMLQYAVNSATMRNESLDNMSPLSIMTLENINREKFDEQMAAYEADRQAVEERVLRSILTLVQADPTKPTKVNLTPIRQLWESYDEQKAFGIIVDIVAMAFGLDRQDLAPLSTSAMGSGAQSTVLDAKSRGKGHGNILAQLESMMQRILPASCKFEFDFQDDEQDLKRAQIRQTTATTIKDLAASGGSSFGGLPITKAFGEADPASPVSPPAPPAEGIISRDEARQILMQEIPEWASILDPDMSARDQVVADELDPELTATQEKRYGPRARFHSKSRQTVILQGNRFRMKARRTPAITDDEIADARKRLEAIGIDVSELRRSHASA